MTTPPIRQTSPSSVQEDEIDLIALARALWEGRKSILKTIYIFIAIGLFVAIFSEEEYTSTTTIVPQATEEGGVSSGLSGLAAMAGINLGGGTSSELSPLLYPQIVNSIAFQKELMQIPLTVEGQDVPVTFARYYMDIYRPSLLGYLKKYTIGLPGLLRKLFKSEPKSHTNARNQDLIKISVKEHELSERLQEQISVALEEEIGYITVTAKMPMAIMAAEMAKNVQELLQKVIIDFKIKKSSNQLAFVTERYLEKEAVFKEAQHKLALFRDQNQGINSALATTNLEALQNEYDLAFSVYSELASQLEAQQIQVKQDTPVFTIIDPVSVPFEKSKPQRVLTLLVFAFLGTVLGIGWVFGGQYLRLVREYWNGK